MTFSQGRGCSVPMHTGKDKHYDVKSKTVMFEATVDLIANAVNGIMTTKT